MSTTSMLRPTGSTAAGRPRTRTGAVRSPRPSPDRRGERAVAGRRQLRRGPVPAPMPTRRFTPSGQAPFATATTPGVRGCVTATGGPSAAPAVPASPARRPGSPSGVRLTRRGRLVCVAVLVGLAVAVLSLGSASLAGTGVVEPVTYQTVTVEAGQSLWEIASSAAPTVDPRTTVARIVELNRLTSGGGVRAGQQIIVPVAG